MEQSQFQRAIVVGDTTYVVRRFPRGGLIRPTEAATPSGAAALFPTVLGVTGFLAHHLLYRGQWEIHVLGGPLDPDASVRRVFFVRGRRAAEHAMGSVLDWLEQGRALENFNVYV